MDTLNYNNIKKSAESSKETAELLYLNCEKINLFDKKNIKGGYYNTTGVLVNDSSFFNFTIDVFKPSVYFLKNANTSTSASCVFLDKDKLFISAIANGTINFYGLKVCTPANCRYIVFSNTFDNIDKFIISENEIKDYRFFRKKSDVKLFPQKNLFDKTKCLSGISIDQNGLFIVDAAYTCSDMIEVLPSYTYSFSSFDKSASRGIVEYDKDGLITKTTGTSNVGSIYTTQPNTCYMRIAIKISQIDEFQIERGDYYTGYEKYIERDIPYVTSNTAHTVVNKTSNAVVSKINRLDSDLVKILAVRENHVLFTVLTSKSEHWSMSNIRYTSKGIDSVCKTEGSLLSLDVNFPNVELPTYIVKAIFFKNKAGELRTMVFTSNNKAYYSDNQIFGNYKESKVWDIEGHKHPAVGTEKDPTGKCFRLYMPSDIKTRKEQFSWMGGIEYNEEITPFGVFFANYMGASDRTLTAVSSCLFYTNDGANIYVKYSFAGGGAYKLAGNELEENGINIELGDPVNTINITGNYTTGLKIKRRINVTPNEKVLNETNKFIYTVAANIISISKSSECTVTHDGSIVFKKGDNVIIEGTSGTQFDTMTNNTCTQTSAGNNVMYCVSAVNGNTITLSHYIGNSDNNLNCWHIHCLNKFANGYMIGTGEEYPGSWLIYLNTNSFESTQKLTPYRYNTSGFAIQRPLGIHMRADGRVIFASDTDRSASFANSKYYPSLTKVVEGRDDAMPITARGVWIGEFGKVDDWNSWECVLKDVSVSYFFKNLNGVLINNTMGGGIYYSINDGDSFIKAYQCNTNETNSNWVGYDKAGNRNYFTNSLYTYAIEVVH